VISTGKDLGVNWPPHINALIEKFDIYDFRFGHNQVCLKPATGILRASSTWATPHDSGLPESPAFDVEMLAVRDGMRRVGGNLDQIEPGFLRHSLRGTVSDHRL
jgi:hypothetical protein